MLPGRKSGPGGTAAEIRLRKAVPVRLRTGSPWRDIPEHLGKWSVFGHFRHWVFSDALSEEFDLEWVFVDGTVVQMRQKARGREKVGPLAAGSDVRGVA